MKHSTKIWLLQVLWLFLSFHTMAVAKDLSGKDPYFSNAGKLYELNGILDVNSPPPPIVGDVSVCEGEVVVYTYPATPGYVYTWNVTNGSGTPSGNSFTVTWGNPGAGTVTIIVKDAGGTVVDTQVLPVTVHAKPYPYITASFSPTCKEKKGEHQPGGGRKDTSDCFVACDSSVVVYSTPLNPGSTYTWTVVGANSFTPSGNTVSVYWGSPGNGLITVTETNVFGCTNTFEKCVEIIESPDAFFTSVPPAVAGIINICAGQGIQFYDASTGSISSPLMDWFWDFGDGGTSTDKNPYHVFAPGSWTVTMYVENECHCKDSFTVKVVVSSDPVPIIQCVSTVCANGSDDYYVDAAMFGCPGAIYNWTVSPGGTITSLMPYGPHIQVQWGASGPGVVSLQIIGCGGCPSTASVVVSIISPTTTINGPNPACQFSNAIYSIPNMSGSTYTWSVTGGFIVNGQGTEQIEVNWFGGTTGTVSVTYYNPSLYCGGSASLLVNLRPPFALSGPMQVCDGSSVNYNATPGTPAENAAYNWTVTNSSNVVVATFGGSDSYPLTWSFGPGIYQITVTNGSGAFCNSPQSYFVTVYPAPPPPTFISGTDPVCPGKSYLYTSAPTIPGTFIEWTVTNGTPGLASGNTLTVTWGAVGPYILDVRQVSMTYPNCPSAPFSRTILSKLPAPPDTIYGPDPVCKNSIQNYWASSTSGDEYIWDINTPNFGSVISGQGTPNVQIQWNNDAGVATISLTVKRCGVSTTVFKNVTLTNPPLPVILAPDSACQNDFPVFSTTTTGTAFSWDFGDGSGIVSGAGPHSHQYTATGTFNVTLTVTNPNGCLGQTSVVKLINIKPAPDAAITTSSPTGYCPGSTINTIMYVASLLQPGSTIQWNLNGSPIPFSTLSTCTATVVGDYTATITNVWGCSTISNIIKVRNVNCTPCPIDPHFLNFTATKNGCMTYDFVGNMSGNGTIVGWYFDDPYNGTGSTSMTPSHTYSEPGYYRVILSARFPKTGFPGDSCIRDTAMVVVIPIKAKFSYEISCGTGSNYNVNFIDLSTFVAPFTLGPGSWNWSFPGGTPSASGLQNPTVSYPAGFTYPVTLTLWDATFTYTCTYNLNVVVPGIPNPSIIAPDSTCQDNPVVFTTTPVAPGSVNSWLWDFGDVSSSALYPTTRTYTAPTSGWLTVTLTIVDQFGCNRVFTKPIFVNQNTVAPTITAGGPTTFCDGGNVTLNSSVLGATAPLDYLWSTVDTTANIVVTQTGSYYVEVTDARGCHNTSNTIDVVVNPVPTAMIVGRDSYCDGDLVQLSGFQGTTYTYQWIIDGVPGPTGPTLSQMMTVGPHNIKIIITNTLNGCKDTSAVYPIVVHPLPPIPGLSGAPTPLCEGSAITLTATTGISPYTFNWSTGGTGNSIVVYNAGLYSVTLTDQFGCQSQNSLEVHELPDFSNLMTGCYEFCDTADVTLVGPTGIGFIYQWYMNGVPIPGPVGTVKDLIIPVGANGIYQLEITTWWGCNATSGKIDVTFIKCKDCNAEFFFKDIVCVIDSNGTRVYYFTVTLLNPFPAGATYSFTTPGGLLTGLSPASLMPGMNTITGFFVDVPPLNNPFCLDGTIYYLGKKCLLKEICRDLPDCKDPEPCHADSRWLTIQCAGKDANGNQTYYFDYEIGWPGANGSPILSFTSPEGTITNVSLNDINNGYNLLSGIFTDITHDGAFCFELYVFDPSTGRVCYFRDCIRLPKCEDVNGCKKKVLKLKSVKCNGFDVNGNQTYRLDLSVSNPFGSPATVYFTTPDGGISGVSPSGVPTGVSTVSMMFTDLPPATGSMCIKVIIVEDATGKACTHEICFLLPTCKDDGSLTGINGDDEKNNGSSIAVNPNPAKEQTVISYTFTTGSNRIINVTDMYGRTIKTFNVTDDKGTITLQTGTYSPGIYMVTGFSDNKLVESKRLVITK
jgi:PKD repeat protein